MESKSGKPHCEFYVKSKQRFCKFPVAGEHGFCFTHEPCGGTGSTRARRLPCPLDVRHQISEDNVFSHLRCCTRSRDIAWELCQPFVVEGINEPQPPDSSQVRSTWKWPTRVPSQEEALKLLHSGIPYDQFVETLRPHQVCPASIVPDRSLPSITAETDVVELHQTIDTLYQSCCNFLNVPSDYFLQGLGDIDTGLFHTTTPLDTSYDCPSSESPLNPLQRREAPEQVEEFVEYIKGHTTIPNQAFKFYWNSSSAFQQLVQNAMAEINHKRECSGSSLSQSNVTVKPGNNSPPGDAVPEMNKHEIQNASLLAICLGLKYFSLDSRPTSSRSTCLFIEFGAGTLHLFTFRLLALDDAGDAAGLSSKFVLIDREKRRDKSEAKDAKLSINRQKAESCILRLRADIRDFDLAALLHHILGHETKPHDMVSFLTSPPKLVKYLLQYGCMEIPTQLVPSDINNKNAFEHSVHQQVHQQIHSQLELMSAGSGPRLADLREKVCTQFGSQSLIDSESENFKCICLAKHLCGGATDSALRCIAKGREAESNCQTTTALKHVQRTIHLAIAPCCHHRCSWDSIVGIDFLQSLGLSKANFHQFYSLSGWATGATGLKQIVGIKVKRIIDTARIAWLHTQGFPDAKLLVFVSSSMTSLESVVIVGTSVMNNTHY